MNEEIPETLETASAEPKQNPSAEEMLERLSAIDIEQFNLKTVLEEVKGKQAWIFVMVMPLSAITLVLFTLLGTFLTGYFIASFVITSLFLFMIGKLFDQYEQKYRYQARLEVMRRIQATEGDYGLLIHFKDFLPKRYRHSINLTQNNLNASGAFVTQNMQ